MKPLRLSRRAVLRGAGGAAIALPCLEIMGDRKAHAAPPVRYLVTFAGVSTGTDRDGPKFVVPTMPGLDYGAALDRSGGAHALDPVMKAGLGGEITVVSNLRLPRGAGAAHWNERWHAPTMRPLLTGMSSTGGKVDLTSPTSDVLASERLGGGTRFPHLALRAQPRRYRSSEASLANAIMGRLSANARGPVEPFVDPGQVFSQLFGTAGAPAPAPAPAPGMPGPAPKPDLGPMKERAVVDTVLARAQRLHQRLGAWDRRRLDQHLTEIQEVQRRLGGLASTPPVVSPGTPTTPTNPATPQPGAGCAMPTRPNTTFPETVTERTGWSNETLRAQLMNDLMYLALACDLTRAASLMYTFAQSFVALTPMLGYKVSGDIEGDVHEVHHGAGNATDHARVWAWHVGHWVYLLEKLKGTAEPNGTLLDNCMVVFLTEGGYGSEAGGAMQDRLNDDFTSHSGNNMLVMLAGRAGGRLSPKGHLDGGRAHPTQVVLSAMQALGVPGPLGEITQGLPGLA